MVPINITPAMRNIAERGEKRILAGFRDQSANYTGLVASRRFYIGILGELAFAQLLKDNGKRAIYAPTWQGRDHGDVFVYSEGYKMATDVKTAGSAFHDNLFIPTAQYQRYTYDGYIGVRIVDDVAEIHGYCSKKDFVESDNLNIKVPTMCVALADLRPMKRILAKLDDGETIIKIPA